MSARPLPVIAAMVIVGIPAGLAVFTGAYWLIRRPDVHVLLSFVVGLVLLLGLNATWERRYGGRPFAVIAMAFGVVVSGAYQFATPWGFQPVGVSWIVLTASALGLIVLYLPEVRAYFGTSSVEGREFGL